MKIRLSVSIDLKDPADWTAAYGVEGDAKIREDVASYVHNMLSHTKPFDEECPADIHLTVSADGQIKTFG